MGNSFEANLADFVAARYGLFIHYGLYSLLGRGEWALNREHIDLAEYAALADRFTAERYDAEAICALAKAAGMRYICLTTMHHDGFMLYPSEVSRFHVGHSACGRDLVGETVAAARRHGLRMHLYHSLNHWTCEPDAVAALESPAACERFIAFTFDRLRELVTRYNPIEVLWYDGWWPFNADGWRAEAMNRMLREIQPWLLVNGRNGLPGDFTTPEGHMSAPNPWRPWEACLTLNDSWSYTRGDDRWKSPSDVLAMLVRAAQGNGNLLLGIGPEPDGAIPARAAEILRQVGDWLRRNGEAVYATERFDFGLMTRAGHRGDWSSLVDYTVAGHRLYLTVKRWQGETLTIAGLRTPPLAMRLLATGQSVDFTYEAGPGKVTLRGLPPEPPGLLPVIRVDCGGPPEICGCGGMRTPSVPHPPYDPCPSDLAG